MSEKITGGCLCGDVAFEVDNQFDRFFLCHCKQCRKITGTSYAANLFAKPSSLTWLKGETSIVRFDLPGRDMTKAFCEKCGSGVPFVTRSKTAMIIPAGSLNEEPKYLKQTRIFYAENTNWCLSAESADSFDAFSD